MAYEYPPLCWSDDDDADNDPNAVGFSLGQDTPRDLMSDDGEEDDDEGAEVNQAEIPTQPVPDSLPPASPRLGGGLDDSDQPGAAVADKYLSPYLWGKTLDGRVDTPFTDNPAPFLVLNVHIPDVRRLDELLFLVRLDPKLRAMLSHFKHSMNGVAVAQNKYRQHSNGGRFYGIGCNMQFAPRWIRNYLFGDNCLYLDCTSTWAFALVNLKRVMEVVEDTPLLDEYTRSPADFRVTIKPHLKFKHTTAEQTASSVKQIILWAVHGYDSVEKHLTGDGLVKVVRLASDVDNLTQKLINLPQLNNLLSDYKATEEAISQLEIDSSAAFESADQQRGEISSPPNKKKAKKGTKQIDVPMFMMNPEHIVRSTTSVGKRLSALYTLVESETTYAMHQFLESEEEFDTQIMIFDGVVARPRLQNSFKCDRDVDALCERVREYVLTKVGWDMPLKAESMAITPKQYLLLSGPKVFHDLPPLAQLIRHIIYMLGELRGLKRFGNALLEEVPKYPGLYQILRYPVKGSTGSIVGTSQDPMPLIHATLDSSPYAAYASCAHEKKLLDWFMENQDMRFEKFYMRGTNMWLVRFEDGICDFNTDDNTPYFRDWEHFKTANLPIPVHFLSYPETNYRKTLQHIREFESGLRPDSPTPLFDKFIEYQLCPDDIRTLRILLGRLQMPLKDGWNVCVIVTGPEQVGKSLILNEIKKKVPLDGQLVKVLTGKSSDKFPLGDVSNKHLIVTDEAESLISKLGYDLLKSLVSNGAFDADVKYKSETSKPDGAGLLLVGVGNSLLDQCTYIDKAFIERVAWFKFENLVTDQNRDPTLGHKLGTERGAQYIYQALCFLNCMKTPDKAQKFWLNVASPNLRENRELAKLEGDLCAQLLNNHSEYYRILPDPNAEPLFVDELHKALMAYMQVERKLDPKKLNRNWLDSLKRIPYYSVRKEDVCSRCHKFSPNRRTCGDHYSKFLVSKRDVIYGMTLQHFPLGVEYAPLPESSGQVAEDMDDLDEDEKDPAEPPVMNAALFMSQNAGKKSVEDTVYKKCDDFCTQAKADNAEKFEALAGIARAMPPPGSTVMARTYRRREAKTLYPELGKYYPLEIDRILTISQGMYPRKASQMARVSVYNREVVPGDSWRPVI